MFHKDISLGVGSEALNVFFVPSLPPFDVIVDSGGAHVHAKQGGVVGWCGEGGLPSAVMGPLNFVYWSTQPAVSTVGTGELNSK